MTADQSTELVVDLDNPDATRFGNALKLVLNAFGFRRGRWIITIAKEKRRRRNEANRYWWGVIVQMFQEFNSEQGNIWTPQQCHDILKANLLPCDVFYDPVTDRETLVLSDSHTLSVEDFGSLIERAIVWLAEMGIVVPDPPSWTKDSTYSVSRLPQKSLPSPR